jgi:hypothetical protein
LAAGGAAKHFTEKHQQKNNPPHASIFPCQILPMKRCISQNKNKTKIIFKKQMKVKGGGFLS